MATIILQRPIELINGMRTYRIFVDGQRVGRIRSGGTLELHLEPGEHEVIAKIDWCRSRPYKLHLAEGGARKLRVSSFKHGNGFILACTGLIVLGSLLWSFTDQALVPALPALGLLALVYVITFGWKDYLRLTDGGGE